MSTRTTIPDPYDALPVRSRQAITCYLAPEVHFFFVRQLFLGTPGAFCATINQLIEALRLELEKQQLTKWEIDSEQRITELLKRVNFRADAPAPPARRPNRRAAKPAAQPPGQGHDAGTTPASD